MRRTKERKKETVNREKKEIKNKEEVVSRGSVRQRYVRVSGV
jgi:hypothetical protein